MRNLRSGLEEAGGYKELRVWKASMDLVVLVYGLTAEISKKNGYALVNQLHRSAISVPSNIAEGHSQGTNPLYRRHIRYACGSAAELETQLLIARRTGVATEKQIAPLLSELSAIRRQLFALRNYLDDRVSSH